MLISKTSKQFQKYGVNNRNCSIFAKLSLYRENEEYHIVGGSRNSNHCSIGIGHLLHRERMER